jgi:hypothetical protein
VAKSRASGLIRDRGRRRRWPRPGDRRSAAAAAEPSAATALGSELLEPVLNCVVMSNAMHSVSQPHKGELVMGAGIDAYNPYAQRGSFHVIEPPLGGALALLLGRPQAVDQRRARHDDARDRRALPDAGAGAVSGYRLAEGGRIDRSRSHPTAPSTRGSWGDMPASALIARGGGVVGPAFCDSLFAHRDVLVVGAGRASLDAAPAASARACCSPALGCFDHGYAVLAERRTTPADQRRQGLARERWRATSSAGSTRACAASCATTSRAGASGWATSPSPSNFRCGCDISGL